MPEIGTTGDRLHFSDEGDGPLVLFVHGSCGGSGQWRRMAAAMGDGYRKVRVDLPGMGASEPYPLERVWTLDDDVRAITALIDHLDQPFHFVGHSAGCIFSWRALQARAARLQSLTLFEPVFFSLLQELGHPLHDWPCDVARDYRARVEAGNLDGALEVFVDRWAGQPGACAQMPEKVRAMMQTGAPRLYHEWAMRLQPEPEFRAADLAAPEAPTLLVEGSETVEAVKEVCNLIARARPETRRMVIQGAGHMAPFTHADEAARVTAAHIGESA